MTKEQIDKLTKTTMNNSRISMELSGKKISDLDFEKIKNIAFQLEKLI